MQKHDLQRLVKEHAQKLVKSHRPLNGASACIAADVLVAAGQKTIPPNYKASDVENQYKTRFLRVYNDVNEETVRFGNFEVIGAVHCLLDIVLMSLPPQSCCCFSTECMCIRASPSRQVMCNSIRKTTVFGVDFTAPRVSCKCVFLLLEQKKWMYSGVAEVKRLDPQVGVHQLVDEQLNCCQVFEGSVNIF